jgi:hypothetical protein
MKRSSSIRLLLNYTTLTSVFVSLFSLLWLTFRQALRQMQSLKLGVDDAKSNCPVAFAFWDNPENNNCLPDVCRDGLASAVKQRIEVHLLSYMPVPNCPQGVVCLEAGAVGGKCWPKVHGGSRCTTLL